MIKKYAMNKIFVSTLIFGLLLLFYLVPSPSFEVEINEKDDNKEFENVVYLLDDDNYVSRVISYYDETDIDKVIRNKINILIKSLRSGLFILCLVSFIFFHIYYKMWNH